MTGTMYLRFFKVNVSVESANSDFLEFLAGYFSTQVGEGNKPDCQIRIIFKNVSKTEYDELLMESERNYAIRLSRSIFCENTVVFLTDLQQFPGLLLKFKIEKDWLEVSGYYCSPERILSKLLKNKNQKLKLYLYLKYYLILFPLIWYYEHFLNKYLLHASALLYKDQSILFSGLGGVGKSTLVISLLNNPGFQFISDNLILYGDDEVIGIREAIALDEKSLKLSSNTESLLSSLNLDMSHSRKYYHVKNTVTSGGRAKKIFFLKFNKITRVLEIKKTQAREKIELINSIAKEVIAYRSMASSLNLSLGIKYSTIREASIDKLIQNAAFYELDIKPGENLTKIHSMLQDIPL